MASAAPAIKERRPAAAEPPLRLKPVSEATPARPAVTASLSASPQAKSFVSSPGDPAEREADRVAKQVMEMPAPAVATRGERAAQRAPAAPLPGLPRAASPTGTDSAVAAKVRAAATGGAPLSRKTRAFLEPRFRADFSNVMVHTDPIAVRLATELGARAFTYGRHIFFGAGQYNPDSRDGMELLAHELTHTIQQSETIQRKEADAAEAPRVSQRTERQASRLGISDVLDYFADAANAIPGYRMFTILIGVNPINMSAVEASAANILRAIVEFLPGGNIITRVLDSYGIFDKVGGWIEAQLKSLGITGAAIKAAINEFIDSLGWRDIFHLGSVWNRAKRIFTGPIDRIISFAKSLFAKILEMVQEAVLKPLAALAARTPFYTLLKAVLGKDPVTGEKFDGGATEVIGGFMTMIGQDEIWQNIQKANAIPRAFAWFKTAMKGLISLVTSIPTRFIDGLKSLEIMDFVVLPRAFIKIGAVLGSFLADFGSWALGTVFDLLKIIIEVVAPDVMVYIKKAAGAFQTIVRNPGRFVRTLIAAGKKGFSQFASNFLTHLKASLIQWLTGSLGGAGIYIPSGLSFLEILKFALSIMGLTWQNIRAKLVRATNETTVVALETGFDIVKTLVTQGPAAAWQKIMETLSNLKQLAIDAVMDFVKGKIVEIAMKKLTSLMAGPAGAFIEAVLAIYNTIMFFIERLRQIAQVAAAFIDGIAAIAAGNIAPAANKVETTMAGLLTLVISFLARLAGLGKVSDAVIGLINKIRAPIDRALDAVVNWIVTQARGLGAAAMRGARGAVRSVLTALGVELRFSAGREQHRLWVDATGPRPRVMMASNPAPLSQHLGAFRTEAGSLPADKRSQTLAAIGRAQPIAAQIDTQAQAAANALLDQRPPINQRITQLENAVRPDLIIILNNRSSPTPTETDEIPLTFVPPSGPFSRTEYTRQLGQQQSGINAMFVSQWLRNRDLYVARREAQRQAGADRPSGRDPASRSLQANLRTRIEQALVRRLVGGPTSTVALPAECSQYELDFLARAFRDAPRYGHVLGANGGFANLAQAQEKVANWMSRNQALHTPDQVVGGEANQLTGMGQADVNGDIGRNWGGVMGKPQRLASILETNVRSFLASRSVPESMQSAVRMKVRLTF